MKTIALITARGGSKGIPRKNLAQVAGRPLIAWTIEAALASHHVERVLVSTDDPEIAAVSEKYGAEVPFLRPAALAGDTATSLEVALHALDWLAGHAATPDYLLLLQPTSPLRQTADIEGACALAESRRADAVLSVCDADPHPYLTQRLSEGGTLQSFMASTIKLTRRQDYPPAYHLNGAIYLNRPASLYADRTFQPPAALAYVMPQERSLDIDTAWDLHLADLILSSSLGRSDSPLAVNG